MQNTSYKIGALQRALVILDALAETSGVNVAELATFLQVPKGSVFRHLKVLEANGYVRQCRLRSGTASGAEARLPRPCGQGALGLGQAALPFMAALRDRFGETVHLGVLTGGEIVHVEVVPSVHPVKMASAVGDRTWAHVSGLGRSCSPGAATRPWGSSFGSVAPPLTDARSLRGRPSRRNWSASAKTATQSTTRSPLKACAAWPRRYATRAATSLRNEPVEAPPTASRSRTPLGLLRRSSRARTP